MHLRGCSLNTHTTNMTALLNNLDTEVLNAMQEIQGYIEEHKDALCEAGMSPTIPTIATMTVACKLSGPIEKEGLSSLLASADSSPFNVPPSRFKNSAMLQLPKPDGQRVRSGPCCFGIKLFANGILHITGARRFADLVPVMEQLALLFEQAGLHVEPSEFACHLVNANFKVGKRLPLAKLSQTIAGLPKGAPYRTRGMSSHYPGLIIKAAVSDRITSIHLFSTGSTLLSGIKAPKQLAETFVAAMDVLLTKPGI